MAYWAWGLAIALFLFVTGACQSGGVAFQDPAAGISFTISTQYQQESVAAAETQGPNRVVARFVRSSPVALVTIRRETGLRKSTSVLRRTVPEHFLFEIRQFFPVRYGAGYQSLLLQRRTIAGRDGVEHVFHFTSWDATPSTMRLLLVPWDDDTAFYLALESAENDFDQVASDLDLPAKTLKLFEPQRAR